MWLAGAPMEHSGLLWTRGHSRAKPCSPLCPLAAGGSNTANRLALSTALCFIATLPHLAC